jgi:hypothetical protein
MGGEDCNRRELLYSKYTLDRIEDSERPLASKKK